MASPGRQPPADQASPVGYDDDMTSHDDSSEPSASMTRRTLIASSAAAGAAGLAASAATPAPAVAQAAGAAWPEPAFIRTNGGLRMAVHEAGADGVPVVMSHGFPELAYSWRHQLPALAEAGFRALAPDQRGYGNTQRPLAIEAYSIVELCADLVGLLDARGIEKAVFVGHDWGGAVVWDMARQHPDRVLGVVGVNTATGPRPPRPPVDLLRQMRGENNYVVAFQEPYKAEDVLEADVEKSFRTFMRKGSWDAAEFNALPADAPERKFQLLDSIRDGSVDDLRGELLLTSQELAHFVRVYERTGFTGGVNWYRNIDRNWELAKDVNPRIDHPCLYVGAENDVVLPPSSADGIEALVPNIDKHTIADCGHWTQQEKPDEFNRVLVDWLQGTFGA